MGIEEIEYACKKCGLVFTTTNTTMRAKFCPLCGRERLEEIGCESLSLNQRKWRCKRK